MIDQIDIEVTAGKGGDGAVSFRREKFVPRGGPDGGDGGRGGDVILVADPRMSTLGRYRLGQRLRAPEGTPGGPNQRRGASADSLRLPVPVGTIAWDITASEPGPDAQPVVDLSAPGAVVVARAGRGGWGNKRFTTPTRQAPKFAQRGAPGEQRRLRLELKLIADVGLVGLPNAGKSTLLRAWSRATPRVAAYPFTTLEPELGVVELGYESFVAADMPGLIEGASAGVGLGHEFLRHIERTRVLVHVLDLTRDDPLANRELIDAELEAFGHGLSDKPQLLALNKVDDPDGRAHLELLAPQLEALGAPWLVISAATTEGTRELAQRTHQMLRQAEAGDAAAASAAAEAIPVLRPEPRRRRFEVERDEDGVARVRGVTPEWLATTLDISDYESRQELFLRMRRMGIARAVERLGVDHGDPVRIGDVTVRWEG
ncbi:MAG: GTPase ObgE [Dehalococcoidia bacterium]|nr:GTPase ObgE [Dehalococcoidia bacterium]